ncbi:MAG: HEAT repeat domain-containing protein [Oligoflexia bacterium]
MSTDPVRLEQVPDVKSHDFRTHEIEFHDLETQAPHLSAPLGRRRFAAFLAASFFGVLLHSDGLGAWARAQDATQVSRPQVPRIQRITSGDRTLQTLALHEMRQDGNLTAEEAATLAKLALEHSFYAEPPFAETLRVLKPKAALPVLMQALDSKKWLGLWLDHETRLKAAVLLGKMGNVADPAIKELKKTLLNTENDVLTRAECARALGQMPKSALLSESALTHILIANENHPFLRLAAADALLSLSEAAAVNENAHNPKTTPKTATEITKKIAIFLIRTLREHSLDIRLREMAAHSLGQLGKQSPKIIPTMVELIVQPEHPDALEQSDAPRPSHETPSQQQINTAETRRLAKIALKEMGNHARAAIPRLVEVLSDQGTSFFFRDEAAHTLRILGNTGREAAPALLRILLDQEGESELIRVSTARALIAMGYSKQVVPALIEIISSPNSTRSALRSVLDIFKALGNEAKDAKVAVTAIAENQADLRELAEDTLIAITEPPAQPLASSQSWKTLPAYLLKAPESKPMDLCSALEAIARHVSLRDLKHHSGESSLPLDSWDVAIDSLQRLFVSELNVSPIQTGETKIDFAQSLKSLMARNKTHSDPYWSGADIYAKIFLIALLDSKRHPKAQEIKELLANDLRVLKDRVLGGSVFNTYTYGAALVALAPSIPEDILASAKQWLEAQTDPMRLPYAPHHSFPERSRRASAARNPPLHLALFLSNPEDSVQKARLLDALEVWMSHAGALLEEVPRDKTHQGPDQLAPYYFYSSLPYVSSSLKFLEQSKSLFNKSLSTEELRQVRAIKTELRRRLPELMTPEGDLAILPGGKDYKNTQYRAAPAYTYPLYGLALIPLLEEGDRCMTESLRKGFGLIDWQ